MNKKIRNIRLRGDGISEKTRKEVTKKYHHLSDVEYKEVSQKIGMEFFVLEASKKMKENETCFVELLDKNDKVVTRQKLKKKNGDILIDGNTLRESLGREAIEPKEFNSVIFLSDKRLEPEQYFIHSLSEVSEADPEYVNMYGFASALINGVRNNHGKFKEDPEKCERILRELLIKINPILNINKTIAEIKLHNVREMLTVCETIANADTGNIFKNSDSFNFTDRNDVSQN